MTEYDLGKVVGDNGDDGVGIASITKTGTSGLVDTYTITYTDGDTDTFQVTNGSDASVTIVTSFSGTTSDSKVPSEKLTKTELDKKISTSSTTGLVKNDGSIDTNTYLTSSALSNYVQKSSTSGLLKNDGTVDTTSYSTFSGSYSDLSNKPSIPSASSDLSDGSDLVKKSQTSGLLKNDGSVMTSGTGSSNWAIGNHTHSAYVNPTKVTSWSSTPSDSNVASEKLIKDTLDTKQATLVSGTSIKTINNESLLGSGNITIQGGSSVDIVTQWESTPSDSKVPSEKLTKEGLDLKIDVDCEDGNTAFYEDDSLNGHLYLFNGNLDYTISNNKLKYGSYELATVNDIPSLTNYVQKSNTTGLIKNDGSIDTSAYITSSALPTIQTSWGSTTSDSKVASEKLIKSSLDGKLDNAISSTVVSVASNDDILITDYSDSNKVKRVANILASQVKDSTAHSNIGSSANDSQATINGDIDTALSNKVSKSNTSGLLKNDGSVDTSSYITSSAISGMLTSSDIANNLTTTTTGKVLDATQGKALKDLIGDAITYINQ